MSTIKDLIEDLQRFDPDQVIEFTCSIEDEGECQGCSYSITFQDEHDIEQQALLEMELDEEDLDVNELHKFKDLVGVIFTISGEITDYEYDKDFD